MLIGNQPPLQQATRIAVLCSSTFYGHNALLMADRTIRCGNGTSSRSLSFAESAWMLYQNTQNDEEMVCLAYSTHEQRNYGNRRDRTKKATSSLARFETVSLRAVAFGAQHADENCLL